MPIVTYKIDTIDNFKSTLGKIESEKLKKKSTDLPESGRVFVRANFGSKIRTSSFPVVLVSEKTLSKHLEPDEVTGKGNVGHRARKDVDIELEPVEIELSDPDDLFGHGVDKVTDLSTPNAISQEPRITNLHRNNKMGVYNELKMSILNSDRKLKGKLLDFGNVNQMAYAPHYYGQGEDRKPLRSLDEPGRLTGDSRTLYPTGLYSNANPSLLLTGDLCDTEPTDDPATPATCTSCCKSFDTRDLLFVFLFGLIVGLLAIIAATLLYTVFYLLRKSCSAGMQTPYEITLTRDHHYREPSDECQDCKKCKKCCPCTPEPKAKKGKLNPRLLLGSVSDVIPTSKWRLCPKRNYSCEPMCGRKTSVYK